MTVKEWCEYWHTEIDRKAVATSSWQQHGYILRNHVIPGIGELELTDMTSERIAEFYGRKEKEVSQSTLRNLSILLCKCLDDAVDEKLLTSNPAAGLTIAKPNTFHYKIFSRKKLAAYLETADELGYPPLFRLAVETGIHLHELLVLEWRNLDEPTNTLSHEEMKYPISEELTRQLVAIHQKYPHNQWLTPHPGTFQSYTAKQIYRMHRNIMEKAGLSGYRFQDLRHTYAVLRLKLGDPAREVSDALGNGRTSETKKYYEKPLKKKTSKADSQKKKQQQTANLMDSLLQW